MANYSTIEECLSAVWKDGLELKKIPKKMKTHEVCLAAVRQNPHAIKYATNKSKSAGMRNLCLLALAKDPSVFKHLPNKVKTHEMCLAAVKLGPSFYNSIPQQMMSQAVCFEILRQNNGDLSLIRMKRRSYEVCMDAVKLNGLALERVPEHMKTPYIIATAIAQNPEAAKFSPKEPPIVPKTPEPTEKGILVRSRMNVGELAYELAIAVAIEYTARKIVNYISNKF